MMNTQFVNLAVAAVEKVQSKNLKIRRRAHGVVLCVPGVFKADYTGAVDILGAIMHNESSTNRNVILSCIETHGSDLNIDKTFLYGLTQRFQCRTTKTENRFLDTYNAGIETAAAIEAELIAKGIEIGY